MKKIRFLFLILLTITVFLFFSIKIVAAIDPKSDLLQKVHNPIIPSSLSGGEYVQKLINVGVGIVFIGGAIIFFFMLLSGAIKLMTSGGDKAGTESAKNRITHALVGLLILFSIFAIMNLLEQIFGFSLTNFTLPTLGGESVTGGAPDIKGGVGKP